MKINDIINEASFKFSPENFKNTEKYSVPFEDITRFAQFLARQMEIMGVSKEMAEKLYNAAEAGNDSWIHRFGKSPKLKNLIGHTIDTAMTSNLVAIQKAMGLHAGVLNLKKKGPSKSSHTPDDMLPGGPDDEEARDRRSAAAFGPPTDPRGIESY